MTDEHPPASVVTQLAEMAGTCLLVVAPDGTLRWANSAAQGLLLERGDTLDPELWAHVRERAARLGVGPPLDLGLVRCRDRTGAARLWRGTVAPGDGGLAVSLHLQQLGGDEAERLVAFAALAAELARVRTFRAAVNCVAAQAAQALGVDRTTVGILDPDRQVLRVVYGEDRDAGGAERWAEVSLDVVTAISEAVRVGTTVHAADLVEIAQRFPTEAADAVAAGFGAIGAVPITGSGGRIEGAIGYASSTAGPAPDPAVLTAVSALVSRALARARRVRHDTELAGSFQRLMLPSTIEDPEGWHIDAVYVASGSEGRAGGDWYDAFRLPGGRQMIVVGDVVGHGPAASAAMGVLRTATRTLAHSGVGDPAELLVRLDLLVAHLGLEGFATMCTVVVDTITGTTRLALAGHPPPTLWRCDGTVERCQPKPGPPVGADLPGQPATGQVEIGPGDVLLIYSDGLLEDSGDLCDGFDLLDRLLATGEPELDDVLAALTTSAPRDDVVLVAVRRREV